MNIEHPNDPGRFRLRSMAARLFALALVSIGLAACNPEAVTFNPVVNLSDGATITMTAGTQELATEPGAVAYSTQCAIFRAEGTTVCGPTGTMEANFDGRYDGSIVAKRTFSSGTNLVDCGENANCYAVVVVESPSGAILDVAAAAIDFVAPATDVTVASARTRAEQLTSCVSPTAAEAPSVNEIWVKGRMIESLQATSPALLGGTAFENFKITLDFIDCETENVAGSATPLNAAGQHTVVGERVDGCHITMYRPPGLTAATEATLLHESAHCWQFFIKRAGVADGELTEFWVTEGFADWYAVQLEQRSLPDDFFFYRGWREGSALSNDGSLADTELSGLFRSDYEASGFWTAYESLVGGPEVLMGIYESLLLELDSLPPYVRITSSTFRDSAFDERSAAVLELLDAPAPFSLALALAKAVAAPGPTFGDGFAWPDDGASESPSNWSIGSPGAWTAPATSTVFLGTGEVLIAALGQRDAGDVWELTVTPNAALDAVLVTDTDQIAAREIDSEGATWTYIEGGPAECPPDQVLDPETELPVEVAAGTNDHAILANRGASMVTSTVSWRSGTLEEWQAENCINPVFQLVRETAFVTPLDGGQLGHVNCGYGDDPLDCPRVLSSNSSNTTDDGRTQSGSASNTLSITETQITLTAASTSAISPIINIRAIAISERRTTVRVEAGTDVRFSWDVCVSPAFPDSAIGQVVLNGSPTPSLGFNSSETAGPCSGSEVLTFSHPAQVTLTLWARSDTFRIQQPSVPYDAASGWLSAQIEP